MSNYIAGDITLYHYRGSCNIGVVTDPKRAFWVHEKQNLSFGGQSIAYTKVACKVLGAWDD